MGYMYHFRNCLRLGLGRRGISSWECFPFCRLKFFSSTSPASATKKTFQKLHQSGRLTLVMDLATQIRNGLQSQGLPAPSLSWIQSTMPNRNPQPPLPALIATVKARLLAADLTTPNLLEPSASALPANLSNPQTKELQLPQDVLVQVLDIDNLSKSKWEQVEELEAVARGEQTRGREVIRLPTSSEDDNGVVTDASSATQSTAYAPRPANLGNARGSGPASTPRNSTHRLVLQDCRGQQVYAIELKRIDRISTSTLNIGEKLMLKKGTIVARGTALLEPSTCVIMGGKVEAWQKAWHDGRLARLRETVAADDSS